jgi:hypothetical protein
MLALFLDGGIMVSDNSSLGIARRNSRRTASPMPELKNELDFKMSYSREEYDKLSRGLVPRNMNNKWFVFLEDNWLHFYRDSSGFCIYKLKLVRDDDRYRVTEAYVNRDKSQYSGSDDDYDAKMLGWLIDNLLLGKRRSPPSRPEWNAKLP